MSQVTTLDYDLVGLRADTAWQDFLNEQATRDGKRGDARSIAGDAMRSRILWTLLIVVFGTTMAVNATIVHLSALLTDRGVSAVESALVVSAMGAASVAGGLGAF